MAPLPSHGPRTTWRAERQRSVEEQQNKRWWRKHAVKQAEVYLMEHWRRIGLIIYATGWFVLFVSFWNLRDTDIYWPLFWPIWYLATSLVTFHFAIRPSSFQLYRLAGAMGVVGLLSRVGGIFIAYATGGKAAAGWQLPVAAVVYSMAASGLWYWWVHAILPWHKEKKGDPC